MWEIILQAGRALTIHMYLLSTDLLGIDYLT
jgi:hypothetical protein